MTVDVPLFLGIILGMTVALIVTNLEAVNQFNSINQWMNYSILDTTNDFTSSKDVEADVRLAMTSGDDIHFHTDDENVAQAMARKVRVLIWVMTSTNRRRAAAVRNTWGKRVDNIIFFSSMTNASFPIIGEGREHLTAKMVMGFRYIYDNHFDDADWFMKVDDNTFVIIENLKYFLSNENHNSPVFFGHHFEQAEKHRWGGGGYVLSKEALRRLATKGHDHNKICSQDGRNGDFEMHTCMEKLGVKTGNSRDALGRSRFHCFQPEKNLFATYSNWYKIHDDIGVKGIAENISDYAISFHDMNPMAMKSLEFYVYHLRPYGMHLGNQNLNVKHS